MSRTLHTLLPVLRIGAVLSALGLVAGYVVLAQRQANPRATAPIPSERQEIVASSSKNGSLVGPIFQSIRLEVTPVPSLPPTLMSGTKGLSPLSVVAPGSKSYVATTMVGSLLATPAPTPVPDRARTFAPSSKLMIFVPAKFLDSAGTPTPPDEEVAEEVATLPPPEATIPLPSTPVPQR